MTEHVDAIGQSHERPAARHNQISARRKLAGGAMALLGVLGIVHHADNNINGPLNTGAAADLVESAGVDAGAQALNNYVAKPAEDFAAAVGNEVSTMIAGQRADVYLKQQKDLAEQLKLNPNQIDAVVEGSATVNKGVNIRLLPQQSYLNTDIGANADVPEINWSDVISVNGQPWNENDTQFKIKDPPLTYGQNPMNYSDGSKTGWLELSFGIKSEPQKMVTGFIATGPATESFVKVDGPAVGVISAGAEGYKSQTSDKIFRAFDVGVVTVTPQQAQTH